MTPAIGQTRSLCPGRTLLISLLTKVIPANHFRPSAQIAANRSENGLAWSQMVNCRRPKHTQQFGLLVKGTWRLGLAGKAKCSAASSAARNVTLRSILCAVNQRRLQLDAVAGITQTPPTSFAPSAVTPATGQQPSVNTVSYFDFLRWGRRRTT